MSLIVNSPSKTAGVIIIGNEILSGRVEDKNLSYIAKNLELVGITVSEAIVIPDAEDVIISYVLDYSARFQYVFSTGGIGPTHDDITITSIAKAFNKKQERNAEAVDCMKRHYSSEQLTEARLKMADIPEGAALIENPISGVPGFYIENVYVLAGVPFIMRGMLDGLLEKLDGGAPVITASLSTNLPEVQFAEGLSKIQVEVLEVSIGSYPYFKYGKQGVSIILRSTDKAILKKQQQLVIELLKNIGGEVFDEQYPE